MDEREFDTINVIPFIDIMLVLLTIVLTTSTFIARGAIPMQLPKASQNQAQALHTLTIEIDSEGGLYLNGLRVTREGLCGSIALRGRDTHLLIRADRSVALQNFVDVMDDVKTLGFKNLSLQTEVKR